jgi:hypothetical protein
MLLISYENIDVVDYKAGSVIITYNLQENAINDLTLA